MAYTEASPAPADVRYPGKRYKAGESPRYVQNAEEDALLGPGWSDSPKKAAKPVKESKEPKA